MTQEIVIRLIVGTEPAEQTHDIDYDPLYAECVALETWVYADGVTLWIAAFKHTKTHEVRIRRCPAASPPWEVGRMYRWSGR